MQTWQLVAARRVRAVNRFTSVLKDWKVPTIPAEPTDLSGCVQDSIRQPYSTSTDNPFTSSQLSRSAHTAAEAVSQQNTTPQSQRSGSGQEVGQTRSRPPAVGYHRFVSRGDVSSENGGGETACGSVSYGFATLQGRRPTLEDRINVQMCVRGGRHLALFGVYDGHGGPDISEYTAQHLLHYTVSSPLLKQSPRAALCQAYERVDHEVVQSQQPFVGTAQDKRALVGSTAVTAVIDISGQRLVLANIGDSRAVLGKKSGEVVRLSTEHNCRSDEEYDRVIAAGGFVESVGGLRRVGGILAVSRAIGDAALRPGVIATPSVWEQALTPEDEVLVLATDGLWDVMGDEPAVQAALASGTSSRRAASQLVETALRSRARDDIACLVVRLHWPQGGGLA